MAGLLGLDCRDKGENRVAMNRGAGVKRALVVAGVALFVGGLLVPAQAGVAPFMAMNGSGYARALDFAIPGLQNLLTQAGAPAKMNPSTCYDVPESCGLSIGATGATFSLNDSTYKDPTSASGYAGAKCTLFGASPSPGSPPPCDERSRQFSYAPSANEGNATPQCAIPASGDEPVSLVVQASGACGNSSSSVASGMPISANSAGVATVDFTIDLGALIPEVTDTTSSETDTIKQAKDQIIEDVAIALDGVFTLIQEKYNENRETIESSTTTTVTEGGDAGMGIIQKLQQAIDSFLSRAKDGGKALAVKAGVSTTDVVEDGNTTRVISQTAGSAIGLLGLVNPLEDGLLIITTSASKAEVDINRTTARATAHVDPVLVTVKARDLLDLVIGSDYITCKISATSTTCPGLPSTPASNLNGSLSEILSNFDKTPLETEIKVLPNPTKEGSSAEATSGGVEVRALKGLGATNSTNPDYAAQGGDRDGGIEAFMGRAYALGSVTAVECSGPCGAAQVNTAGPGGAGAPGAAPVQTNLPFTGGPTRLLFGLALILAAGAPLMYLLARRLRATA